MILPCDFCVFFLRGSARAENYHTLSTVWSQQWQLLKLFVGWIKKNLNIYFSLLCHDTKKISIWAVIFKTSCRHMQVKTEFSASTSGSDTQITITTGNILLKRCCTSEDCLCFQIYNNTKIFFSVTCDPIPWLQVGCDTERGVELGPRSPSHTVISVGHLTCKWNRTVSLNTLHCCLPTSCSKLQTVQSPSECHTRDLPCLVAAALSLHN